MELKVSREPLRFERLIAAQEEQVGVEGEATLPGSMRDAVTVLNVQAQANIESVQAGEGKAILRGQVCFQTLYTQGDLTRIRTMETTCDFEHTVPVNGAGNGYAHRRGRRRSGNGRLGGERTDDPARAAGHSAQCV